MEYDTPSPKTPYGELRAQKEAAEKAQAIFLQTGAAGPTANSRSTLRDRLKRQIERSHEEQHRVRRADELYDLLCKHPEVARILELIEEIGA